MNFFNKTPPVYMYLIGGLFLGIATISTTKDSIAYSLFSLCGIILIFLAIMKHFKK
jgi:hypothetical protein